MAILHELHGEFLMMKDGSWGDTLIFTSDEGMISYDWVPTA